MARPQIAERTTSATLVTVDDADFLAGVGTSGATGAAGAIADLRRLSDEALLRQQAELIVERRRIDAALAALAGEIARRSSREAGFGGLAQRHGYRSAEDFIATATGLSRQEAGSLVRVAAVGTTAPSISTALAHGTVSVAAADAIIRGLGAASAVVAAESLDVAAATLLAEAAATSPEELSQAARALRESLDAEAVVDRERELRRRRSLRLTRQWDGLTRLTALLDPESAAEVRSVFDAITAPRRGGPRLVDAEDVGRAQRLSHDPRTTEQLALDSFVELLRIGADAAPSALIGTRRPAVRIHVTDADLRARGLDPRTGQASHAHGRGRLEGESTPVSITTVERHICATGTVPIHFDSAGQVVNVGREHRLYTARQRIGLAARDGGCRWPGCDRPPSWCEAHHIDEWDAHGGRTDLADGILLCRFHHLMVHDRDWRIRRGQGKESATYWAERGGPPGEQADRPPCLNERDMDERDERRRYEPGLDELGRDARSLDERSANEERPIDLSSTHPSSTHPRGAHQQQPYERVSLEPHHRWRPAT